MEEVHPRPEAGLPDIKRTTLRGPGPRSPVSKTSYSILLTSAGVRLYAGVTDISGLTSNSTFCAWRQWRLVFAGIILLVFFMVLVVFRWTHIYMLSHTHASD